MPIDRLFDEPQTLREALTRLAALPSRAWLYVASSTERVTLDTSCAATSFDARDLSLEEQDAFDALAEKAGLVALLSRGQLEDVQANLALQRPGFSLEQWAAAVEFYWRHDAFINLPSDAA